MRRKRNRLWIGLFICVALLLASLATGWNVVLVQDYLRFVELTREASGVVAGVRGPWGTWLSIGLGSLGFVASLTALAFFFAKVLKETRLNQIQSEFLETVSHELKTPIAAIGLSASLLKAGGLTPDEESRLWRSHASELTRLTEEVNTLLEAARLRSKPRTLKTSAVPLDEWIAGSLDRWKRILGPGATLVIEGDLRGARALVDRRTLDLIADNLVDNARKFSRDRAHLTIRASHGHRSAILKRPLWRIDFIDQGWGFDPADSERIFTRFFRAKTAAPHAIPGNGLGLYLAESAGRDLGLKLHADSPGRGQGARFTIQGRHA